MSHYDNIIYTYNIVFIGSADLFSTAHLINLLNHNIQVAVDIIQLAIQVFSKTVSVLALLVSGLHGLLKVAFFKDGLDLTFVGIQNTVEFILLTTNITQIAVDFTLGIFNLGDILM